MYFVLQKIVKNKIHNLLWSYQWPHMASHMVNHSLPIRAIAGMSLTFRGLFLSAATVKVGETYSPCLKTTFSTSLLNWHRVFKDTYAQYWKHYQFCQELHLDIKLAIFNFEYSKRPHHSYAFLLASPLGYFNVLGIQFTCILNHLYPQNFYNLVNITTYHVVIFCS